MSDSPKMQKLRALASVTPTDLAGWGDRLTTPDHCDEARWAEQRPARRIARGGAL